jgi:choline dehydrogenase-like flavoprotein
MQIYENIETVDAVVIGTGAGGSPLMARLAQSGLKVVALEAGKFWDPATEFATDEREQGKLFWPYERLSTGNDPLHFGRDNSGIGVGGSTLHYTAYTPRPQPDDFKIYTEFGIGKDWPISYDDLEPYFDELENFLGISGPSPYPWGPARKTKYPLPPLNSCNVAVLNWELKALLRPTRLYQPLSTSRILGGEALVQTGAFARPGAAQGPRPAWM